MYFPTGMQTSDKNSLCLPRMLFYIILNPYTEHGAMYLVCIKYKLLFPVVFSAVDCLAYSVLWEHTVRARLV